MDSLQHLLNIGTLATWLSVGGFGSVAVVLPGRAVSEASRHQQFETQWLPQDFTLGGEISPAAEETPLATSESDPADALPAPPDLPDAAEMAPLPDVPEPPLPAAPAAVSPSAPRPSAAADSVRHTPRPAARKPSSTGASSTAAGTGSPGGGSGLSNAARLAAGSMPTPAYPAEARRLGQSGTLVVEFTVDSSGQVISAYAISPSPWPLLNQEAVRTVRRWRFPPGGGVMKLQRPIVFQLR